MEQKFCQSCGMPLVVGNIGTNSDGRKARTIAATATKEVFFSKIST